MNKQTFILALAAFFIGVLISLHLSIEEETPERDTRDLWEIRTALLEEQEQQQTLQDELNDLKNIQVDYEDNVYGTQIRTLRKQINDLQDQAGLTEMTGQGVELMLVADYEQANESEGFPELTSELLNRLVNELNVYGANHLAVGDERIVNHTAIRDVLGRVYINQRPLRDLPVTVKVLTDDPERLINYMEVSQSLNDLAIHNISLTMNDKQSVTVPSYTGDFVLEHVDVKDYEEGDE
ncbi:Uncharacterized conserved protein YlxW, UPF0749 family [Halolactibacillus halophilus]|uniref:UPF0749 protein YlxX n=1 Tax=Halolactibacillus halophilus TaxID=306540 RepID=A0A1I5LR39_9BACI|nr:DUF881 domain-containing protein [Halolactibacillus halophilus]GEM00694.1 UPF0749 protein YlxX [Halolactibacillus halophilus]SFO99788.1 Uncharacterized conserved protein YlxW, UPF0749 family [Halolactibacillus halophilus]